MKVFTYCGAAPLIVPPDHSVFFAAGTKVTPLEGGGAILHNPDVRPELAPGPNDCVIPGCGRPKYGKISDRCWPHLSQGVEVPEAHVLLNKEMLRDAFNIAAKECLNHGAVPSAFYGLLEAAVFGGKVTT